MSSINVIISDNTYTYDKFTVEKHKIEKCDCCSAADLNSHRPRRTYNVDCAFMYYLSKELILSELFRTHFVGNHENYKLIKYVLRPTKHDLIDYNWNDRVDFMVRERCELDHTLSWLSTLGGAFSALGDYFSTHAITAGKISFHQLQLAMRLDDPNIAARCKLYLSLSLIQRRKFNLARRIIYHEYISARNSAVVDIRLVNMCKGIWSKLQYEYKIHRKNRKRK